MGLFRDLSQLPKTAKGGVLVIGNFDGVHKGHQAVLARALEKAEEIDGHMHARTSCLFVVCGLFVLPKFVGV